MRCSNAILGLKAIIMSKKVNRVVNKKFWKGKFAFD